MIHRTGRKIRRAMQLDIAPGLGLPLRWQQDNDDDHAWHQHAQNPFLPSALDGSEDKLLRTRSVGL